VGEPQPAPDRSALASLLGRAFGGEPGLEAEFPTLTDRGNAQRSFSIACEDGTLAAHAAWRPLALRSGERRISAAGIGLVATAPELRGRGLARRVVERCIDEALRGGAELALMFGELSPLYARLGFARAGRERITRVDPADCARDPRVVKGTHSAVPDLLALLEGHPLRVERSAADFERVLDVVGTHLYLLADRGTVLAYCVEGKGRDLGGVIHEWAGDPGHVEALIRGVVALRAEPLWALSPLDRAAPLDGEHAAGALALFRVLRPDRLGGSDVVELLGDERHPARLPIYVWGLDSV